MNKNLILIIVGVVIIVGGVGYKVFLQPAGTASVGTGKVKEFTITVVKNSWSFKPEEIDVERGEKVVLTIVNEDDFDHGFAIDAYDLSERVPANQSINLEFVATQAGEFPFYCTIPCGEGEVSGKPRGHFDMMGKIKVSDIVRTQ